MVPSESLRRSAIARPLRSATARVGASFRSLLSGDAQGRPEWVTDLASGPAESLFEVDGPAWTVHASLPTLVGGIRALLLQTLHPVAVDAVDRHSAFRDDPIGRLRRTTRWLTVTTFGTPDQARDEAGRVNRIHERVTGMRPAGPDVAGGAEVGYRADDPDLLAWVHAAFTDSFLTAHQQLRGPTIPGGPDAYVADWARSAELLGLTDAPADRAGLDAYLTSLRQGTLTRSAAGDRAREFLLAPPLPTGQRAAYRVLLRAATATLDPHDAELLDLPSVRVGTLPATRGLLAALHVVLGPASPAESAARQRMGAAPRTRP